MQLTIDLSWRNAKQRAHTATHLLHFMLDHLLWWTKQAWSLVDDDYLRFDFAAKEPLTYEEITKLEAEVNEWIFNDCGVTISEMSLEQAKKTWAKAFFEDKYGDIVRVIQIPTTKTTPYTGNSTEFCGWTHVASTAMIGAFKITNQEAVASGIRRLEAVTWPNVASYAQNQDIELIHYAQLLDCSVKQLPERIQKTLNELDQAKQLITTMQKVQVVDKIKSIWSSSDQKINHEFLSYYIDITKIYLWSIPLKNIVGFARTEWSSENRILYTPDWQFALHANAQNNAKELQKRLWLTWGGNNQLVQWKDPHVLDIV